MKTSLARLDTHRVQRQVLDVGLNAYGYQGLVCFEDQWLTRRLVPGVDLHATGRVLDALDACVSAHVDAQLGVCLLQLLTDFFIFQRQYARQHFDQGHFGAIGAVDERELHADGPSADDDEALG